ncbi:major histocompatibility complex class I-related gene protein-like [Plectropomus leopardus]|uniref:major histocompatibility complex class I-related gene protein-like n=1 Tax=Plectropomus leopardus TaxID=160734 RepID=UPI001C4B1A34|nr:major histocompatibility complex class I-related gene protein-like [Plectropomus leopardus]
MPMRSDNRRRKMDRRQQNQLKLSPRLFYGDKMKTLLLLLLFCHVSSAAKHTLSYLLTASSAQPDFSFVGAVVVDGVVAGYCDSKKKVVEPKQEWMKRFNEDDPQHLEWHNRHCYELQPNFFKATIYNLKQRFNQTGGVHIFQRMSGCDWDDETNDVRGYSQYGYDGEDLISLDLKTLTWITTKPQALIFKTRWDTEKERIKVNMKYLKQIFPVWLRKYLAYSNGSVVRTEHLSVSLLQKTPSSPVSCHATGFYPDSAMMFWRKDEQEIHEGVDPREVLPNHDQTFQMSVDLDVSTIPPEAWSRYDCVFHLSGAEDVVTTLDKAAIRTNRKEPTSTTVFIIAAVVFVAVVLAAASTGFMVYRKKKADCPPCPPDNDSELSVKLNQDMKDGLD